MVATTGHIIGRRTSGVLQLWPTGTLDRSPTWPGERPPAGDTAEVPLYGATDIDWQAVGAPVENADPSAPRKSTDEPRTDSRDPLHPGVLVLIQNGQHPGSRQTVLVIGTLSNRRVDDGKEGLDGVGIALWVRRITDAGFDGTWKNWGLLVGGSGYFCSTRTRI
jgi:hypothetical protein